MSDSEKGVEGSTSKETEWDMLSLSSSAYTEKEPATESLFMSGHFVFPPNEHENLPIEPEVIEPEPEPDPDVEPESVVEQAEEQLRESIEYLSSPEGIKFFEEGQRVTIHDSDEEEIVDDNGTKNERDGEKVLPCEAWWKRHAICLYKNVKEANTIWSVLVATALMGLVILGHRWHKEKFQVNSRWRFNINNEMTSKILGYRR